MPGGNEAGKRGTCGRVTRGALTAAHPPRETSSSVTRRLARALAEQRVSTSSTAAQPIPGEPLVVNSAAAARERAERLHQTGRYAGVDAYSITVDEEAGDYSEPVFHARLGMVPDYEG